MKDRRVRWTVVSVMTLAGLWGAQGWAQDADRFERTHSRSQYVHRITLYDASNRPIDPDDPNAPPYSPKNTCAKCHDYEAISHGYHFNAPAADSEDGRRGEPWIWTDARSGTQIPVTYRDWPGTLGPEDVGLSDWEFVLEFGRHMPGGGLGDPSTGANGGDDEEADEDARWGLAGGLAIDCMICHSGDQSYRHEVWADQIADENFAWAPTAALGLAEVEGAVGRLPDDFDPAEADDDSGPSLPATDYDERRFDSENKVLFDIVRSPSNNACYACHSTRPVGANAEPKWTHDEDIHLRAGMSCVDCHRNGIEHHTVRGYEGEEHPAGLGIETLSCRGCHMGPDNGNAELTMLGGRLGAPEPRHEGIPPIHFEKVSCTSCHSGPAPGEEAGAVQTSLAHGLGLPSQQWSEDDAPAIAAPVFLEDESGKVTPHRMVWPAYWGRLEGGEITPVDPDEAFRKVGRTLRIRSNFQEELSDVRLSNTEKVEALGEDRADADDLTEDEQAALDEALETKAAEAFRENLVPALEALARGWDEGVEPVYLVAGKAYRIGEDGETAEAFDPPEARPYFWPLAHDVRPARRSLGVRGCAECHAADSPFYYGTITAAGPAPDDAPAVTAMHELRELDTKLLDAWAGSFQGRSAFKVVGFIALAILLAVLLLYGLLALGGLLRLGAQRGGSEVEEGR